MYEGLYKKHNVFIQAMDTNSMSDAEDDADDDRSWKRVYPDWVSYSFSEFKHRLDLVADMIHTDPVIGNLPRGARAHFREHTDDVLRGAPITPGLPRNCYEPKVIGRLTKAQIYQIQMLEYDHDFSIDPSDLVPRS